MAFPNIEDSLNEIMDNSRDNPAIATLKALLNTVIINRRAMEIVKALNEGDKDKATTITINAKNAGIPLDVLKAACRAMKK